MEGKWYTETPKWWHVLTGIGAIVITVTVWAVNIDNRVARAEEKAANLEAGSSAILKDFHKSFKELREDQRKSFKELEKAQIKNNDQDLRLEGDMRVLIEKVNNIQDIVKEIKTQTSSSRR